MSTAEIAWRLDPASMFLSATEHAPAEWQKEVLRCKSPNVGLAVSRQGGKSTLTSIKALHVAMFYPESLILLAAPGQAQATELLHKCRKYYKALGSPRGSYGDSTTKLELGNNSRILALTGNPDTVRGYSAPRLLVVDEASRVEEELITALSPMLAAAPDGAQFLALSTPRGRNNWFWEQIFSPAALERGDWSTWHIGADGIEWLSKSFLRKERLNMTAYEFDEEYGASFNTAAGGSFDPEWVRAAVTSELSAWNL